MLDLVDISTELPSILEAQFTELTHTPSEQLGEACEELSLFYRVAAIAALLLELDTDEFYHMLTRSALTRVYLLNQAPTKSKEGSRYCRISRANTFFDAVAAERFDVAKRIVDLSPDSWAKKYEYEDDYCYVLFLHKLLINDTDEEKRLILNRFENALQGAPSPRYEICFSLFEVDEKQFEGPFSDLLDDWTEEIHFQERSICRNEFEFAGARHIFVEGLALLRLAELIGIKTEEEYPYCPKEARIPMQKSFSDDSFLTAL